jgi:putative ATP-binding cassette transporter
MRDSDVHRPALRLNRESWQRFTTAVRQFAASEVRAQAIRWFALLIGLLLAINALNVLNSYVGRDIMTAIAVRDAPGFLRYAVRYIAVFALLTLAAVYYRFAEERLGLLWRDWLTRGVLHDYVAHRTYYRLRAGGTLTNPDQRIADDIRTFVTSTLSLSLLLLNGALTVLAFAGVLWSISPLLFLVAVAYAGMGSLFTVRLGRPLVRLNYNQADREADFRADLVHLREHAESVAMLHRENRIHARLLHHLDELIHNLRRIVAVNRQLGFFTTLYNYLIPVVPMLIIAPRFIRGEIEFGVITQSAVAFSHLLGAFSLIITQFQSISSYAAVLGRLSALRRAGAQAATVRSGIEIRERDDVLSYEELTLRSPRDGRLLIDRLTLRIPPHVRVLVRGGSDTARVALVRATAGIWEVGEGRIVRPHFPLFRLLPEKPYLPPGTLRELIVLTGDERIVTNQQIEDALCKLGIENILPRIGGLDIERAWHDILSLDEQQLVSCARMLLAGPRFALLDRIGSALGAEQVDLVLSRFSDRGITYVAVNNTRYRPEHFDAILELASDGSWAYPPLRGSPQTEGRAAG